MQSTKILYQELKEHDQRSAKTISIENFCSRYPNNEEVLGLRGTHIFYLPAIEGSLWSDGPQTRSPAEDSLTFLREVLQAQFHVPEFFWDKMGWNANGFFGSVENPLKGAAESHSSFCRFLMKEVDEKGHPEHLTYHWRYLAFHSLWFRTNSDPTRILLCFDLNEPKLERQDSNLPPMRKAFAKRFKSIANSGLTNCPYEIYKPLLEEVVTQYNRACWTFRKPVRDVEKKNGGETHNTGESSEGQKTVERRAGIKNYQNMHELSRHIIHATETLAAASNTVSDIIEHSKNCPLACCEHGLGRSPIHRSLQFHALFLVNLKLRARSFDERMRNQIQLAFNLVGVDDTENTKKILAETKKILAEAKNDGKRLTQLVSIMTVLFLPPTWTAGFLSMNFFSGLSTLKLVWIYFAISIPLSAAIFLLIFIFTPSLLKGISRTNPRSQGSHRSPDPAGGNNSSPPSV